ncbi:MAG: hypothetical protein K6L73_12985 [Cellvibrionaceae bacterium]
MMLPCKSHYSSGPDFISLKNHSFDFSGTKLSFELPGNLDREFPVREGISRLNIHDNSNYNDGGYYPEMLLDRHWNYKGRIWQNFRQRYASLGISVHLGKSASNVNLFKNFLQLEELNKLTKKDYWKESAGNVTVLKVRPPRDPSQPQRHLAPKYLEYFIPVEENHFVVLDFKYYGVDSAEFKSIWSGKIESDIQKIINSIKIEYAPSVQARIDKLEVSPE